MPEHQLFLPEGMRPVVDEEISISRLREAVASQEILETIPHRCDPAHTLHFSLNGIHAYMERQEASAPWISGAERDISVLSMVGKPACFTVLNLTSGPKGEPIARLSRRAVQERVMDTFLEQLTPGTVLACRVTHLARFGTFLDIGCGIIAMLPIEYSSVSRVTHPKERFYPGQKILAAVLSIDPTRRRITMTHRELLGTWMENACEFQPGETVRGIVRSIKPYGTFIELTPNLSGLTDLREGLSPGDGVSVFIKSIQPEYMKIKLHVIDKLPPVTTPTPLQYRVTDGRLTHWVYSPADCEKRVETIFTESVP